jgi:hypothetical protein
MKVINYLMEKNSRRTMDKFTVVRDDGKWLQNFDWFIVSL